MNTTPIEFMAWDKLESKIVNIKMWDEELTIRYNFMQLTALRSINYEPIYNHMIVKDQRGDYYLIDMFKYALMWTLSWAKLEIVGNRFQNSELLELCK